MAQSLKELVVKLIDRNIQRQRESGLTIYAVSGVIVYATIFLVKTTPEFINPKHFNDNLVVLTNLCNTFFCSGYFFVAVFGKRSSGLTKIFPKQDFLSIDITFLPYFLFFGLLSTLNLFSLGRSWSHSLIYLFFALLVGVNFVSPLFIKVVQWWRNRKRLIRVPEFSHLNTRNAQRLKVSCLAYGLVLSIPIAYSIATERVNLSNAEIVEPLEYGLCVIGLLFLIGVVLELRETSHYNDGLQELEQEIYLSNLSDEEIKKRLENEYLGQDFKTWVQVRKQNVSEFVSSLIVGLAEIQDSIGPIVRNEMSESDAQSRYFDLFSRRQILIGQFWIYHKDFGRQINHLRTLSSIEQNEWVDLVDLQDHFNIEIERIGSIDRGLFEFFSEGQSRK